MIILASASPARKKIFSDMGFSFSVEISDVPEFFDMSKSAKENAILLAEKKGKAVSKKFPQALVVSCDTIMTDPFGNFLEKPKNAADAQRMMENRSGKTEYLVSGISFFSSHFSASDADEVHMDWKILTEETQKKLLESREWEGKCGGVAIEGFSGFFVETIHGNYHSIMGFPVPAFWRLWEKLQYQKMAGTAT